MSFERSFEDLPVGGNGHAFGTFGELLQGVLPNDRNFLVTLPIQRYTHAWFQPDPGGSALQVYPVEKQKSARLASAILTHFGLPPGATLTLNSNLPVGKGFASSSCDLVATARAIADAYQIELSPAQIERFLAAIEPTDGVMYDSYVAFYHREVRLGALLGPLLPLTIVSADEGGQIDTLEFNKIPKPFNAAEKDQYQALYDGMIAAFKRQDLAAIGRIATCSAQLNQKLRPKVLLNDLIRLCDTVGGLGVATAHSGTVTGALLTPLDLRYPRQLAVLEREIEALAGNVAVYQTLTFMETLTLPLRAHATLEPLYLERPVAP